MTQLKCAKQNKLTDEMRKVMTDEGAKDIRQKIANGLVVIPKNKLHDCKPIGIGQGLRTKVNANIGSSPNSYELEDELKKLEMCLKCKADTVMDLSTGGDIDGIRREIIKRSNIPVGTVPVYQAIVESNGVEGVKGDNFIDAIERHIKDGVDFITVHAGVTRAALPLIEKRHLGVVSRGGSFVCRWMRRHNRENPLYTNYDRILEIAGKYDVTLSLGDGLRPGALKDSTDAAQIHELKILGELTKRAWQEDVQVIIEGPGHIPLHEIKRNVELQKKHCFGAPFYVLGPLVTDVAPGYDHITSAIGGAIAAWHGADFLCYVTRAEHLRLPNAEEVREGIMAARIAAHSADISKGIKNARTWDDELSRYRARLDWKKQFELAMDPEMAKAMRRQSRLNEEDFCTMCGRYCPMRK